jgi:hypothetical protein
MSSWDVMVAPPTEMPGMVVRLHLPDMRRSLFHTTSERADRDRLDTNASHDVRLALRTIRWALARRRLREIRISVVGWVRNWRRALFRARIASRHSSVHEGTGTRWGIVDDLGMLDAAAWRRQFVKDSTMESTDENSLSSNATDWAKPSQSARFIIQFGFRESILILCENVYVHGVVVLSCRSERTDHSRWTARLELQNAGAQGSRILSKAFYI